MARQHDLKLEIEAMQAGARDLVLRAPPEHLALVVEREFDSLLERRALQHYKKNYHDSETRARALIDSSRDAITYVHDGMHVYANSVYLGMFGFNELEEVEGTPIMDMVAPADHAKLKDFLRRYSKGESSDTTLDVQGLRPDRSPFSALMEFAHASIDGEACTRITIRDQSSSKELEKKIKHLSKQDLLTGLYNRQYFLEDLEHNLTHPQEGCENQAVLYILLDNFKTIKESVGIAGSDLVLGDIAKLLQGMVGKTEVAARFTDNAFTILAQGHKDLKGFADSIRHAIEDHISEVAGQSITSTASIGAHHIGPGAARAPRSSSPAPTSLARLRARPAAIASTCTMQSATPRPTRKKASIGRLRSSMPWNTTSSAWCTSPSSACRANPANAMKCCCACSGPKQ